MVLVLVAIWGPVIYLLGAQWSVFPEYQYGWAVPMLCLYLALRKMLRNPPSALAAKWPALFTLAVGGLTFWLMRVLQEANPLWRAASYGLACAAVAMTLAVIYLTEGMARTRHFLFPVAFFLIAVPWPTPVEGWIIQGLTRLNSNVVAELLNLVGLPAMVHGNVLEVASGMVGIDEACSGIRSFQATLMVALFFGEFYNLRPRARVWLWIAGPILALVFNGARTFVLVSIAARSGLPTMQRWHDTTGVLLLLGCFLSLYGFARWLAGKPQPKSSPRDEKSDITAAILPRQNVSLATAALGIAVWAVTVGISTEMWFRSHENHTANSFSWSVQWPVQNGSLQTNIIPQAALDELRCDQDDSAGWLTDDNKNRWQVFFLRWLPSASFYGRVRVAMSKSHNPKICLPAAGLKLKQELPPVTLPALAEFELVFNRYVFTENGRELFVFFSQAEDMKGNEPANRRMTHLARWRAALAGSRNYGQVNLEAALVGPESATAALNLFSNELPRLVTTISPSSHER